MSGIEHNYLPRQYEVTGQPLINHNYLSQQFADCEEIFEEIKELLKNSDFTLGKAVNEFEDSFRKITHTKYAVGVGSGTDALFLSLKALGVDKGDEVITVPYTFYATIGAIVTAGARPVFVDVDADYNMNPALLENAITSKTKAILPVHWSGLVCDMEKILAIANKYDIPVVEDACHAISAHRNGQYAGSFGATGCFSMHPLKNLNVWGDGGVITTNSEELHNKLVLLRNHGLIDRDTCAVFAYNSRLDTLQAIVAKHLLKKLEFITDSRIANASFLDRGLSNIPQITIPLRDKKCKQVFHIYVIRAERRDELQKYLIEQGIDAKVHYQTPMHLQPAAREYGYKKGDFPMAESICESVISLPVHEFINEKQMNHIVQKIKEFY